MAYENTIVVCHRAKATKDEQWVTGSYVVREHRNELLHEMVPSDARYLLQSVEIDPSTLCVCIGKDDATGKDIFTKDILSVQMSPEYQEITGYVDWDKYNLQYALYSLETEGEILETFSRIKNDRMKIIGNIFDSPGLVKWLNSW